MSIDYLIIGHVCKDLTAKGPRLGGTVTYSALMARALGHRVSILTSAPESMMPLLAPLENTATLMCIPASAPTTFKNTYASEGRTQILSARAEPLTIEHLTGEWRKAPIVHLAPVADEVDPRFAEQFPNALVSITPQGWMRKWDEAGHVTFRPWAYADRVLPHTDALVMSLEDVKGNRYVADEYAGRVPVAAVTRGVGGCMLYVSGKKHHITAPRIEEHDSTGAGDVFSAAFFSRLHATDDPFAAARFATHLASNSVTRAGLASIPGKDVIDAAFEMEKT